MRKAIALLLLIGSPFLLQPFAQADKGDDEIIATYRQAVRLFELSNPTEKTDSLAISGLLRVVKMSEPKLSNARMRADCFEKVGILRQTYGLQQEAIACYQQAIASCLRYKLPDSLLFKPYLYSGAAHYYLHSFDSSVYYLKKAEAISLRISNLQEVDRLYNSFGAIYYEAGNYQQSINYFRKAIQLSEQSTNPAKEVYLHSFKSNIASALHHLEQYDSAAAMYRSMIPVDIKRNELLIKLGTIFLEKAQPDSALYYLAKVTKDPTYNPVVLENALAKAFLQKKCLNDAGTHLARALALHKKNQATAKSGQKDNSIGLTYKLLADTDLERGRLKNALGNYQQSIIQLDESFNDANIYHNPANVTAGFRSYMLFESLESKAACFQKLYTVGPTDEYLKATINTYQSALKLAEYIEKSFDSEDAQLFIVRKVFPVYQKAVSFLVNAFERTNDESYLERAFCLAEKSKATTLYINLKDNEYKSITGIPDSLLVAERNLKFNLSRLLLKIDQADGAKQVAALTAEMRDNELALSRLADRLNDFPDYHQRKFSLDSVSVSFLRRKLLNQQTALVSYFDSEEAIFCFLLTPGGVKYHSFQKDQSYIQGINALNTELRRIVPGVNYRGHLEAQELYKQLIKPMEADLSSISSLIIIPHDELSLLPFEVLEDEEGNYLLERFAITYQYAASFLQNVRKETFDLKRTLAVAPFDSIKQGGEFARLPASDWETAELPGKRLTHRQATKTNFLNLTGDASVIHLATHAVANSNDPSRSYVAFYPTANRNDKLYTHELRNIPLSKTNLIFLSACETASGKLLSGEGVMSLSRAFSSAGCPNLVTSLWKAEDYTTAYISTRFYYYLRQGDTFSEALRKAKIDLLHDGQYAQFHSPQYWSHLVFIGIPNPGNNYVLFWVVASAVVLIGGGGCWLWFRKNTVPTINT